MGADQDDESRELFERTFVGFGGEALREELIELLHRRMAPSLRLADEFLHDIKREQVARDFGLSVERPGGALVVVAEFVETVEQQRLLAELGCTEFQGYLYSKPLTLPQLLVYLNRHDAANT